MFDYSDGQRPNPDELLKQISKQQSFAATGKLHVFFGMSAGVGKTYAMLEAAHRALQEHVDVVIGYIETHGRKETMRLTEGIPEISRKKIEYRGVTLEEMDLDAVLARKPELVLVDELAHTNVEGSRHPKRWQDVLELLDAGINVYTTLNVQHLESRKESVESITGITVHETVPDTVLEKAFQIELIDLPPEELLKRLDKGQVYLGEKALLAKEKFFKPHHLTALREIALRLTAEKVDEDLREIAPGSVRKSSWNTGERLMVAVSHSPFSKSLIRTTRRLAYNLEASWIAVHVDTGLKLNLTEQALLDKNIKLAKDLGAEVVETYDPDWVKAFRRIALEKNITQIVMGRPAQRWLLDFLRGGNLLNRMMKELEHVDLHVLQPPLKKISDRRLRFNWPLKQRLTQGAGLGDYWNTSWIIFIVSIFNTLLVPFVGYQASGFIFLMMVLSISLFYGLGPIIFSAICSMLIWNFFFIPPLFTFAISEKADFAMLIMYLVTALVTGVLTGRIRYREKLLESREKRSQTLYDITQIIADAPNIKTCLERISAKLTELLGVKIGISLVDADGHLGQFISNSFWSLDNDKEKAVADWAFKYGQSAGWSTNTLPAAEAMYVPLIGASEKMGILALQPDSGYQISYDEENILHTTIKQLSVYLEKMILEEKSQEAVKLKQSEVLHQTLLNSVSHDLRTPLTVILGTATALENDPALRKDPIAFSAMLTDLIRSCEQLNRTVENLLDLSRLNSGILSLKKEWHELSDLIIFAKEQLKKELKDRPLQINIPEKFPLLFVDAGLMIQVLSNLLINAVLYTPEGTGISIGAKAAAQQLEIMVRDFGQGISEKSLPHLFEKFYRVPGSQASGSGLGLAIVKSIVELHGGQITASNHPQGGAQFTIQLPLQNQPKQ